MYIFIHHRITEYLQLKAPLNIILANSSAQVTSPKTSSSGPCQDSFWISPRRMSHWTTSCRVPSKKYFFMFKQKFLYFSLCPLYLVTSLDRAEKSLSLSSLRCPFSYSHMLIRFPLSLPFSRLNSPSCLSFSSYDRCSRSFWPFIGLSPVVLCVPRTGEPRTGHNTPGVVLSVPNEGQGSPPSTCWEYFA